MEERRERDRERERDSTLIPGFSVHVYTDARFLTLSNILSHHTDTEGECVCVCVLLLKRRAAAERVRLC